jgi:hypothetical protein
MHYVIIFLMTCFISSEMHCSSSCLSEHQATGYENQAFKCYKKVLSLDVDSFVGVCSDKHIILTWVSLSGICNDHYTIEKSYDAINWIEIGTINGPTLYVGKSTYTFNDTEIKDNILYYRLKHTSYSGLFSYSGIIDVNICSVLQTEDIIQVFPNPSIGIYNLMINEEGNLPQTIEIFNHLGEKIYEIGGFEHTIDLSGHPIGLYYVHFNIKGKSIIKKITLRRD